MFEEIASQNFLPSAQDEGLHCENSGGRIEIFPHSSEMILACMEQLGERRKDSLSTLYEQQLDRKKPFYCNQTVEIICEQ